ncbi:hypothetical protein G7046_g3321 [Stylonectria norvegica]|nr:hypothetical protein G7046_g3321 [Stylonectria norvegica]
MSSLLVAVFLQENVVLTVLLLFIPLLLRAGERHIRQLKLAQTRGCKEAKSKAAVKDPFIGLDFLYDVFFGENPARYLESTCKEFQRLGSTYTVKRWTWKSVYTCDPENIKQMLAVGFEDFDLPEIRVSAMAPIFGKGIFTLTGKPWAHSRAVLRRSFKKQDTTAFIEMLEQHFQEFAKHVPVDGTDVDLQPLFFGLTMDIATEFLMGHSTHMLDTTGNHEKEQQFVDDYMVCSAEVVQKMRLGPLHPFRHNFKAKKAKTRIFRYVDDFINESLQRQGSKEQESCLMNEFMVVTKDRKALIDQILHILLASRDTTASLLSNLFFLLAKKPEIYAKLQEEVSRMLGDRPPTAKQLKEMVYLKWVVNESLRLHPVVPTNAREASRDTTLPRGGGTDGSSPLFVQKGTVVLYNVYAMHRNEEVFGADPEEFIPERWNGLRPGWGYLPFNGGTRICIGQQFALLETYYIVARMVQTCKRLESQDDGEWTELCVRKHLHFAVEITFAIGLAYLLQASRTAFVSAALVLGADALNSRENVIVIYAITTDIGIIPTSEGHVIIRSLQSLENLGGVTVVSPSASDPPCADLTLCDKRPALRPDVDKHPKPGFHKGDFRAHPGFAEQASDRHCYYFDIRRGLMFWKCVDFRGFFGDQMPQGLEMDEMLLRESIILRAFSHNVCVR